MKNLFYLFFLISHLNYSAEIMEVESKEYFEILNTDKLRSEFLKLNDSEKIFFAQVSLYLILNRYIDSKEAEEFKTKYFKKNIDEDDDCKAIYKKIKRKFRKIFNFAKHPIEIVGLKMDNRDFEACLSFYTYCYQQLKDDAKKDLWTPEHVKHDFYKMLNSMLFD